MNYYYDHHHSFDEIVKSVSQNVEESLESLVQLKDLRHLDISQVSKIQSDLLQEKNLSCKSSKNTNHYFSPLQCNEAQGVFVEPSQFLERLVIALTK